MSKMLPIEFDLRVAADEIEAFRSLLDQQNELSEADVILPFFRARPHLSALIGQAVTADLNPNRIKHEMVLFGDYRCDLVVGNSRTQSYCFVEFEDAKKGSVFRSRKGAWEYSPPFREGIQPARRLGLPCGRPAANPTVRNRVRLGLSQLRLSPGRRSRCRSLPTPSKASLVASGTHPDRIEKIPCDHLRRIAPHDHEPRRLVEHAQNHSPFSFILIPIAH
jgi:hypothetical protein